LTTELYISVNPEPDEKKSFLQHLSLIILICLASPFSRTFENSGKPIAEILLIFIIVLMPDIKTTGYNINRAYVWIYYIADENFSAK